MESRSFISLIDSVSSSYNWSESCETFDYFEASCRLNDIKSDDFSEDFCAAFEYFDSFIDDLIVEVKSDHDSLSTISGVSDFVEELKAWSSDTDTFPCFFSIKIHKRVNDNGLNVYSFPSFERFLNGQTLYEALLSWARFDLGKPVSICVHGDVTPVQTSWLSIFSLGGDINVSEPVSDSLRKVTHEKRNSASHFANASEILFIPEDFEVNQGHDTTIGRYFSGIEKALLVVFVCDYSEVFNDKLRYSFSGYKTVSDSVSFFDLKNNDFFELRGIYKYVYISGSFTDKVGLARNVISLHLSSASICSIESGTLSSVKSGYNLYLKDNVRQYIEIKNRLLEFLREQTDKASEVSKGLFSSFKMKFWAFTTFFVSVFLLRSLQKSTGSFIDEKVLIPAVLLVAVSFIYLYIMVKEGRFEKSAIMDRFDDMELRYKDLLDEKDLSLIIDAEKNKQKIDCSIEKSISLYFRSWVLTSLLFLGVLVVWWKIDSGLSFSDIFNKIFC